MTLQGSIFLFLLICCSNLLCFPTAEEKLLLFHPPPPNSQFYKHSLELVIKPGLCFDLDTAFNSVSSAGAAGQMRSIGTPAQPLIFSLWS